MTASHDRVLTQAYELIEANQIDEARDLLQPLLDEHPDDPDVWWVYAHAVTDRAEARRALEKVKSLDADAYPEVDDLLGEVGPVAEIPARPGIRRLNRPAPPASLPASSDVDDFADDDFGDDLTFESDDTPSSGRRFPVIAAVVGVLAILAVLLVLFASGLFSSSSDPTPTDVAAQPSVTPGVATDEAGSSLGVPEVATENIDEAPAITEEPVVATDSVEPTLVADAETETATGESVIVAQGAATDEANAPDVATEESTLPVRIPATEDDPDMTGTEETASVIGAAETEESIAASETEEPPATVTEPPSPTDEPEPTETPTDEPTATQPPTETPTSAPTDTDTPVPSPTENTQEVLESQFSDFDLYEVEPFISQETDAGNALLAAICITATDNRQSILQEGMATFAGTVDDVPADVDAVGVALQDCERERTLRSIVVPRDVAEAFAGGEIDAEAFQLAWQVVG
ncbi:MAG: hypothetical protein AAF653_02100 [Chloroflexota bacterium]